MSFNISGGSILTQATKLTTTGVTNLLSADKRTTILSIIAAEITGNTPTLTLELYDGTTSYYLRFAAAMTANQVLILDSPFVLNTGWKLRATAGTANRIDCFVNYVPPDATALGTFVPLGQK